MRGFGDPNEHVVFICAIKRLQETGTYSWAEGQNKSKGE